MNSNNSSLDIAQESMIVIFGADGRIADVHHFVTAKGGVHPTEKEQEKAALESATRAGVDSRTTSVLHIAAREFDPARNYRVDPAKRVLVESPRLTRQGRPTQTRS